MRRNRAIKGLCRCGCGWPHHQGLRRELLESMEQSKLHTFQPFADLAYKNGWIDETGALTESGHLAMTKERNAINAYVPGRKAGRKPIVRGAIIAILETANGPVSLPTLARLIGKTTEDTGKLLSRMRRDGLATCIGYVNRVGQWTTGANEARAAVAAMDAWAARSPSRARLSDVEMSERLGLHKRIIEVCRG